MTCRDCLYCICRNCKHYCLADFRGEWNCYIDPDDEACEFFKGKEVEKK